MYPYIKQDLRFDQPLLPLIEKQAFLFNISLSNLSIEFHFMDLSQIQQTEHDLDKNT